MKKVEESFGYHKATDLKRLNFIISVLGKNIIEKGKVLDVGCGNGIISKNLGKEGYEVLGIDVSSKAIEKAKINHLNENVKFENISAEDLVYKGEHYDAIICSEVLEHLEQPDELLLKLHQCLNENGVLIVTVPNGYGPRELLITKPLIQIRNNKSMWNGVNRLKKTLGYSGSTVQSDADNLDHIQFFTKGSLQRISLDTGFKIIGFKNSNFIEEVFPFSFFSNRIKILQELDCKVADILPSGMASGFLMVWQKK